MYAILTTSRFGKDMKRASKRGKNMAKIKLVMETLVKGETLPARNRDHGLVGQFTHRRECHIEPDWLLVYKLDEDKREITFERTGTHSDLFK